MGLSRHAFGWLKELDWFFTNPLEILFEGADNLPPTSQSA